MLFRSDYVRRYTDFPMLVVLEKHDEGGSSLASGAFKSTRFLRASDLAGDLGQENNSEWKTIAIDENTDSMVSPQGSIGYRWGQKGKWNIEAREGKDGKETKLQLSLINTKDKTSNVTPVAFPHFAADSSNSHWDACDQDEIQVRNVPTKTKIGRAHV